MKIVFLVLLILLTLDIFFRDGLLISELINQELYIPIVLKIIFLIIAFVASILLLHAIIWDFNLLPKPKNKKTEHQLNKESEQEKEKFEEEKIKRFSKTKSKDKEIPKPSEPLKKRSKLG